MESPMEQVFVQFKRDLHNQPIEALFVYNDKIYATKDIDLMKLLVLLRDASLLASFDVDEFPSSKASYIIEVALRLIKCTIDLSNGTLMDDLCFHTGIRVNDIIILSCKLIIKVIVTNPIDSFLRQVKSALSQPVITLLAMVTYAFGPLLPTMLNKLHTVKAVLLKLQCIIINDVIIPYRGPSSDIQMAQDSAAMLLIAVNICECTTCNSRREKLGRFSKWIESQLASSIREYSIMDFTQIEKTSDEYIQLIFSQAYNY